MSVLLREVGIQAASSGRRNKDARISGNAYSCESVGVGTTSPWRIWPRVTNWSVSVLCRCSAARQSRGSKEDICKAGPCARVVVVGESAAPKLSTFPASIAEEGRFHRRPSNVPDPLS